jgi:hypothetical protein
MFFGATAFAEAPFSSEGIINQTVELTGVQAATNVDSVSILAGGSATVATGAEVDLESTVNTVEITAESNVSLTGQQSKVLSAGFKTSQIQNVSGTSDNILFAFRPNEASNIQYVLPGWNVAGQPTFIVTAVNLDPNDQYTGTITITGGTFVSGQSYAFESANVQVTADANIDVSTNLLTTTTDSVSISIGPNVSVSTNLLQSAINSVGVDIAFTIDVVGQQLNSTVNSVQVFPVTIVNLSTNLLQSTVNSVVANANADVNVNTNLLTVTLGDEVVTGNAIVNLSTNLLQSAVGNAQSTVSKDVTLTGVSANTTTGSVVINIGVLVTGVQMTTSVTAPLIISWAVVNINTSNTWTVVDIAA